MARRRSKTRSVLLVVIITLACVGGWRLWTNYGSPTYDIAKTKYSKIRKVLGK